MRGDNVIGTPYKPEMTYYARSLVSIGGFLHLMILHSLGLICKFTSIVVEKLGMALEIWVYFEEVSIPLSSASHPSWSIRWMWLVGRHSVYSLPVSWAIKQWGNFSSMYRYLTALALRDVPSMPHPESYPASRHFLACSFELHDA